MLSTCQIGSWSPETGRVSKRKMRLKPPPGKKHMYINKTYIHPPISNIYTYIHTKSIQKWWFGKCIFRLQLWHHFGYLFVKFREYIHGKKHRCLVGLWSWLIVMSWQSKGTPPFLNYALFLGGWPWGGPLRLPWSWYQFLLLDTLPETNVFAPEKRPSQKETIVFQPSIFRRELLVSGRVPTGKQT